MRGAGRLSLRILWALLPECQEGQGSKVVAEDREPQERLQ